MQLRAAQVLRGHVLARRRLPQNPKTLFRTLSPEVLLHRLGRHALARRRLGRESAGAPQGNKHPRLYILRGAAVPFL